MPIFNYNCPKCGHKIERYFKHNITVTCPECTAVMRKVPSLMGYRPDKTVRP